MMAEEIERAGYILTCFWQCVCMPSSWVVREVLQRALPIRRQFELQNQKEGRRAYIAYRAFRGERFQEVRNYIDAFQSEGKLVL